jgi:hypothetical protein
MANNTEYENGKRRKQWQNIFLKLCNFMAKPTGREYLEIVKTNVKTRNISVTILFMHLLESCIGHCWKTDKSLLKEIKKRQFHYSQTLYCCSKLYLQYFWAFKFSPSSVLPVV